MAYAVLILAVLEAVLAIGSWVLSVLCPVIGIRSLLDGEGIRWFFAHFSDMVASPVLAWLVVGSSAVGCAVDSGVVYVLHRCSLFRERVAVSFALVAVIVYVAFVVVLVASPHAVLLSASGRLYPSPFSMSFVPIVSFGFVLLSVVYGVASGRYLSVVSIFHSVFVGIERAAPLFALYVVVAQLYYSVMFVMGY